MKQFICIFALLVCSINAADVCWRDYIEGDLPPDAIPAFGGLYIGQIPLDGMLPSSIYTGKTSGITESKGKKVELSDGVKIMCSDSADNFKWVPVTAGNAPSLNKLVRGGIEDGKDLYIGLVFHENQWKIGKYQPWSKNLRVWTAAGGSATLTEFKVLQYA